MAVQPVCKHPLAGPFLPQDSHCSLRQTQGHGHCALAVGPRTPESRNQHQGGPILMKDLLAGPTSQDSCNDPIGPCLSGTERSACNTGSTPKTINILVFIPPAPQLAPPLGPLWGKELCTKVPLPPPWYSSVTEK